MKKEELNTKMISFAENFSFIFSPNEAELLIKKITSNYEGNISIHDQKQSIIKLKKYIKIKLLEKYNENSKKLFKEIDKSIEKIKDDVKKLKIITSILSIIEEKITDSEKEYIVTNCNNIVKEITSFLKLNKSKQKYSIDMELLSLYPEINLLLQSYIEINNLTIIESSEEKKGLLTTEETKNLYKRYKSGDKTAKEELIIKNIGLVRQMAYKFAYASNLDYDDFYQEGILGLDTAIEKFKPELGYALSTYATWYIKQRMQRYVENTQTTIRLPVHKRQEIRNISKKMSLLSKKLGKVPTEQEYIEQGGLTKEELQEYYFLSMHCISLEQPLRKDAEEGDGLLKDFVKDPNNSYENLLDDISKDGLVSGMKEVLKEREFNIVCLRNGLIDGHEYTLEEIGEKYGLTRERIRQIEAKAYSKLRCNKKIKRLSGLREEVVTLKSVCNYDEEVIEYIKLKVGIQGKRKIDDQAIMEKMELSKERLEEIKQKTINYLKISKDENIKLILESITNPTLNVEISSVDENLEVTYSTGKKPKRNTKSLKEIMDEKYTKEEQEIIIKNLKKKDLETLKKRYGENLDEVISLDMNLVVKVSRIVKEKLDQILNNYKKNNVEVELIKEKLSEFYPNVDLSKIIEFLTEDERKIILSQNDIKKDTIDIALENIMKKITYMIQSIYIKEEQKEDENNEERKEVSKMIHARNFKQILEESYSKEQIEYIYSQLTDDDKEYLKARYGENLDEVIKIDDKKVLSRVNYILYQKIPNKLRINREQLGVEAIGIKPPKQTQRSAGFIEYLLQKYSEEDAKLIMQSLTEEEMNLIKRKYGEKLDGKNVERLEPYEKSKVNNLVYLKIPKKLKYIKENQNQKNTEQENINRTQTTEETTIKEEPKEENRQIVEEQEESVLQKMKPSLIDIRDALNTILEIIELEEVQAKTKKK